ncbi:hypothetical protein ACFQU7_16505 [Pseudoroseomonas wenyumeiae]
MSGSARRGLGLYNIPAHLPFLDTLARGVIEEMGEAGADPTALSASPSCCPPAAPPWRCARPSCAAPTGEPCCCPSCAR